MVQQISKKDLERLQANGADIKPKAKPVPIKTESKKTLVKKSNALTRAAQNKPSQDSTEAKAAAAAAQQAAQAAKQSIETINASNKLLKQQVFDIVEGRTNRIVKLVVNRDSNQLITELDILREQDTTVINKRDLN